MQAIKGGRSTEVKDVNATGSVERAVFGAVFVVVASNNWCCTIELDKNMYCYKQNKEWST